MLAAENSVPFPLREKDRMRESSFNRCVYEEINRSRVKKTPSRTAPHYAFSGQESHRINQSFCQSERCQFFWNGPIVLGLQTLAVENIFSDDVHIDHGDEDEVQ